jgi:hypothetical protein
MLNWKSMIRDADLEMLEANWTAQEKVKGTSREIDHTTMIKLFDPYGGSTWIVSELDPNSSLGFGLCDLGMGEPSLGYVCLEEIASIEIRGTRRMEQDVHFQPTKSLSAYAAEARRLGCIKA